MPISRTRASSVPDAFASYHAGGRGLRSCTTEGTIKDVGIFYAAYIIVLLEALAACRNFSGQ